MKCLLVVLAAALAGGCSLAPSDAVMRELAKSERSWCAAVNTIYGTVRASGTGIKNGSVVCNQGEMNVRSNE